MAHPEGGPTPNTEQEIRALQGRDLRVTHSGARLDGLLLQGPITDVIKIPASPHNSEMFELQTEWVAASVDGENWALWRPRKRNLTAVTPGRLFLVSAPDGSDMLLNPHELHNKKLDPATWKPSERSSKILPPGTKLEKPAEVIEVWEGESKREADLLEILNILKARQDQ